MADYMQTIDSLSNEQLGALLARGITVATSPPDTILELPPETSRGSRLEVLLGSDAVAINGDHGLKICLRNRWDLPLPRGLAVQGYFIYAEGGSVLLDSSPVAPSRVTCVKTEVIVGYRLLSPE